MPSWPQGHNPHVVLHSDFLGVVSLLIFETRFEIRMSVLWM
ncbi:MAG: hypothetical protein JWM11_304 [Planctomycetaceae bacterium]|nr:hypothetical protein [Planctomycetaceae bacterium]